MKNIQPLLIRSALIVLVFIATVSFLTQNSKYIGNNFFDSFDFEGMQKEYLQKLYTYELAPLDVEEMVKNITVSASEIEYYQYYYGTLSEQIENITEQYQDRIEEAKSEENASLEKLLINEREEKMAAVKRNFEDSNAVMEQIIAEKKRVIQAYYKDWLSQKNEFEATEYYLSYELKDDTGNLYQYGDMSEKRIYKRKVNLSRKHSIHSDIYLGDYDVAEGLDRSVSIEPIWNEQNFTGAIFVTESDFALLSYGEDYDSFNRTKWILYVTWFLGVIALILLCTRVTLKNAYAPFFKEVQMKIKGWPLDIIAAIGWIAFYFCMKVVEDFSYQLLNFGYMNHHYAPASIIINSVFDIICALLLVVVCIFIIWHITLTIKNQSFSQVVVNLFTLKVVYLLRDLFLKRSIGIQSILLFFVFYLGGFGLQFITHGSDTFFLYWFLFVSILLPSLWIYLSRMSYLNKMMEKTEMMANGELTKPIAIKGKSQFAKHAQHLNELQQGVKTSLNEQAKSERLKTELITNVSHDLRTPLTSIITYTDLLKNPNLTVEERAKYVAVLDKKSERLRILIEDLFEVSKMASGNMELTKTTLDVAQLVQQIVGEQLEDFEAQQLDLRVMIEEQPMMANVDGQKLQRVFDNIFNNARKYSLAGTRVYATLASTKEAIELTVKNVSKYELASEAGELTERFKRADLARHTEGSGLGLAIAASIVDLHGGQLSLSADGDLFKVTVKIPK